METNSREPFFGPDSVAWQIHREAILTRNLPRARRAFRRWSPPKVAAAG